MYLSCDSSLFSDGFECVKCGHDQSMYFWPDGNEFVYFMRMLLFDIWGELLFFVCKNLAK